MDPGKNGSRNGLRAGKATQAGPCTESVCRGDVVPAVRHARANYQPPTLRGRDDDLRRRSVLSRIPIGRRDDQLSQGPIAAFRNSLANPVGMKKCEENFVLLHPWKSCRVA